MSATLRITHITTGAQAVTVSLVRTDGVLVAEHTLQPGEAHNIAISDGQRIAIIEPAPTHAQQLATYRATNRIEPQIREADIERALDQISKHAVSKPTSVGT